MDEIRTEENFEVDEVSTTGTADSIGESKADRFKRLAAKRVNAVIKQIDLIGNLSSGSYEYTPEQVEKMFETMQDSLDDAKAKFSKSKQSKEAFSFD